jgi:hypothetical protein
MADPGQEFAGTERFRIQRRLGAGSFGVVYQVYDEERDAIVALKTLHRAEASALYRFKREFRSLADRVHPNLVTLYELLSDGGQWFFTMELVEGVNFLEYVRGSGGTEQYETPTQARPMLEQSRAEEITTPLPLVTLRLDRLRPALRQLVEGICELHQNGLLHRDIKPSNILVTDSGRVVLLDFGLSAELKDVHLSGSGDFVGTPAYMSPEQVAEQPAWEPSDWYSLGVVLYQALTGLLPFSGRFLNVIQDKQKLDPKPPGDCVPGVPHDLDMLCRDLLHREPAKRPTGPNVLERLGVPAEPRPAAERATTAEAATSFVGRKEHLANLRAAYDEMKSARTVALFIRGGSGMGKTALVRSFLETLQQREKDVVVLEGRCYEQESVPYKALDSLVDSLSQHMRKLSHTQVESLLPRDVLALARLFPVLRTVEAVAKARRRVLEIPDWQELRRRAFAALRELLGRLAERSPVILFIDDLQWGDVDSASLLAELLRPPEPPALLLIGCYRSEEVETSPFLQAFLPLRESAGPAPIVREVEIGELSSEEARTLALVCIGGEEAAESRAETIARESGGSPFFIDQLVRYGQSGAAVQDTLDNVVGVRISRLPDAERQLLEVAAVAGRPLEISVAKKAARLDTSEYRALAHLRAAQLIRVRAGHDGGEVEPYHDRIRETVVARLSSQTMQEHHHRLSRALEISGRADLETLAFHFQGAGDVDKAGHYTQLAASEAMEALAFDRAARLYQLALFLETETTKSRLLQVQLGHALTNAGRGGEAAQAFLAAVSGATATETIELKRLAADQLLISGHMDEGLDVLRSVLRAIGMKLPSTPTRTLLQLLFWRMVVRLRGLGFRERDESEVPPSELMRIDTCHSVCRGLGLVDTLPSLVFQSRHLLLALRAGEPLRISRALGFEALSVGTGRSGRRRARKLFTISKSLADRIQTPYATGMYQLMSGIFAVLEGRWKNGREDFGKSADTLRDSCTGITHEIVVINGFSLDCLFYLGNFREYFRLLPELLSEAESRGDLYAVAILGLRYSHVLCYAQDDPDGAEAQLQRAMEKWSVRGFHLQHSTELFRRVEFSLYRDDPARGWDYLQTQWPTFSRSLLLRIQVIRIIALDTRARCALAVAMRPGVSETARARLLEAAERDVRYIEREKTHWGEPTAQIIRAAIEAHRGNAERAVTLLSSAEKGFQDADMALHAVVARRRRGALSGGEQGRGLIDDADAWLSAQNISNPSRLSAVLAPGQWDADSNRSL